MLLRIVSIVFPIFIIVAIAFVYGRRHPTDMAAANRLNVQIFLPALIFMALAGKTFELADNLDFAIGAVVIVIGSGLLAWPLATVLGFNVKTLVFPSMINNIGNMGLPLLLLTFGERAFGAAVVLLLTVTFLQFSLGACLLSNRFNFSMLWKEPVLASAILGVGFSLSGYTVWSPLTVAIRLLGDISIGLMIFSLGIRLSTTRLNAWGIGAVGAVMAPLTGMLVAWAYGELAGLNRLEQDILFVFGALPPAVSCFIMAEQYGHEPDKVASIVMIGNAAAVFFIPLALALRL